MSYGGDMSHTNHVSSLKSQFMETEAWHSFVSESLYDDDSGDSGSEMGTGFSAIWGIIYPKTILGYNDERLQAPLVWDLNS